MQSPETPRSSLTIDSPRKQSLMKKAGKPFRKISLSRKHRDYRGSQMPLFGSEQATHSMDIENPYLSQTEESSSDHSDHYKDENKVTPDGSLKRAGPKNPGGKPKSSDKFDETPAIEANSTTTQSTISLPREASLEELQSESQSRIQLQQASNTDYNQNGHKRAPSKTSTTLSKFSKHPTSSSLASTNTSSEQKSSNGNSEKEKSLLSSFFSVAHTAASTIIGTNDSNDRIGKQKSSFIEHLDNLVSFRDGDTNTADSIDDSVKEEDEPMSPIQNVVFEPMKKSPIATIGKGELSLASLGLSPEPEVSSPMNGFHQSNPLSLDLLANESSNNLTLSSIRNEPGVTSYSVSSPVANNSFNTAHYSNIIEFPQVKVDPTQSYGQRPSSPSVSLYGEGVSGNRSSLSSRRKPTSPSPIVRALSPASNRANRGISTSKFLKQDTPAAAGNATPSSDLRGRARSNASATYALAPAIATSLNAALSPAIAGDRDGGNNLASISSTGEVGADKSKHRSRAAGVVFASEKRNNEFHSTFKAIPSHEKLLDDFTCALSKEILLQGRLYVSEKHVCFNSNILGFVTSLVIPLEEVVQIEKKSTAVLFPNGMVIQTLHAKHIFASFISRDSTFEFISSVWSRIVDGTTKMVDDGSIVAKGGDGDDDSVNGSITLDSSSGYSFSESDDDGSSDFDDESIDEQENNKSEVNENSNDKGAASHENKQDSKQPSGENNTTGGTDSSNPGPATHPPTQSNVKYESNEKQICDEQIAAPLGVVYDILFGKDPSFMRKSFETMKNFDITDIPEFKPDPSNPDKKIRKYAYTKPLGGPIGPKQTRCHITESVEYCDFNDYCYILVTTSTPDIPSGGSFTAKSRYLLSWGENNTTRLICTCFIDWTGKSWIKGAVEKGSIDGQTESTKTLISQLNERVKKSSSRPQGQSISKGKKPRKSKSRPHRKSKVTEEEEAKANVSSETSGGILDGIISIFKTVLDIIPLSQYISGPLVLVLVLTILYFLIFLPSSFLLRSIFGGSNGSKSISPNFSVLDNNNYIVLVPKHGDFYQDMKRKEETNIWDWINDRVDARLPTDGLDGSQARATKATTRDEVYKRYSKQELAEFIRTSQERLDKLKEKLEE